MANQNKKLFPEELKMPILKESEIPLSGSQMNILELSSWNKASKQSSDEFPPTTIHSRLLKIHKG